MLSSKAAYTTALLGLVLVLSARTADAASLMVAWDPSATTGVAGYLVSWGTKSGVYTSSLDVGNTTSQQIQGLLDGTNYYFVVQAYTASHTMSTYSTEVAGQTPATSPLSITCGAPSASSSTGNPVPVTLSYTIAGGTPPTSATCSPVSGSLFPVGTTAFACTATDALKTTASCNSVVVVSGPPPPPTITCPAAAGTSSNGQPLAVTFAPLVSGGVAPLSVTCSPPSGSLFVVGSTPLTCTVTDALIRSASCQGTVVVSGPKKAHGRWK